MVGAGAGFILDIAGDYRRFVLFREKREIKDKLKSSLPKHRFNAGDEP